MAVKLTRMRLLFLMMWTVVICAIGVAQVTPRDYPQWRGKDRDGSASGFIPPARWPDALTRRWRVEGGEGYASPLVVGDIVYVFSRADDDDVRRCRYVCAREVPPGQQARAERLKISRSNRLKIGAGVAPPRGIRAETRLTFQRRNRVVSDGSAQWT